MESVVLKILFIASASAQFGKHVYVEREYEWPEAQKYCRDNYTDLSPLTSHWEEMRLKTATAGKVQKFWIGLYRHGTDWKWSGGGNATYTRWDEDEPDDELDQIYGSACWDGCSWKGWHNSGLRQFHFFCINLIVMETKRTWLQAMWQCKKTHTALVSLASETEHLLAVREIQQDDVNERVWIGLRFLQDRWLWVNNDPLVYQAWPEEGDQDHLCPLWKRCGALTKEGRWENWDCDARLNFICY